MDFIISLCECFRVFVDVFFYLILMYFVFIFFGGFFFICICFIFCENFEVKIGLYFCVFFIGFSLVFLYNEDVFLRIKDKC